MKRTGSGGGWSVWGRRESGDRFGRARMSARIRGKVREWSRRRWMVGGGDTKGKMRKGDRGGEEVRENGVGSREGGGVG